MKRPWYYFNSNAIPYNPPILPQLTKKVVSWLWWSWWYSRWGRRQINREWHWKQNVTGLCIIMHIYAVFPLVYNERGWPPRRFSKPPHHKYVEIPASLLFCVTHFLLFHDVVIVGKWYKIMQQIHLHFYNIAHFVLMYLSLPKLLRTS